MSDTLSELKQKELQIQQDIMSFDDETQTKVQGAVQSLMMTGTISEALQVTEDQAYVARKLYEIRLQIERVNKYTNRKNKKTVEKKDIKRPAKKEKLPEAETSFFGSIARAIGGFFKWLFGGSSSDAKKVKPVKTTSVKKKVRKNKNIKNKFKRPVGESFETLPPMQENKPDCSNDAIIAMKLQNEFYNQEEGVNTFGLSESDLAEAKRLQMQYDVDQKQKKNRNYSKTSDLNLTDEELAWIMQDQTNTVTQVPGYDSKHNDEYLSVEDYNYNTEQDEYGNANNENLMDLIINNYGKKSKEMDLFFTNDIKLIDEGIAQFHNLIPEMETFLLRRKALIRDMERIREQKPVKEPGKITDAKGREVAINKDKLYDKKNTYMLTGVEFAGKQSTSVGCWSVTLASQLKYRGIDFTQQQVRLFRPSGINKENYEGSELTFIGKNKMGNPVEFSQMMNQCKDNMAVHQVTTANLRKKPDLLYDRDTMWAVEQEKKLKDPNYKMKTRAEIDRQIRDNSAERAKIKKAEIEYLRRRIIDGLVVHRSPVSLIYGAHYVTVYGIQGNRLFYYDSLSGRKDGKKSATLDELYSFNMELAWFEELKPESKDSVKSLDSQINKYVEFKNGTLQKTPRQPGKAEGAEDIDFNTDVVSVTCEKTIEKKTDELKQAGLLNENDGFEVADKIYIPKKISA